MTTHFNGPILGQNKAGARRWFGELPVQHDPDYTVLYDDFVGIALDDTNDWTVVKDTDATVAIVADTVGGELAITSKTTTENDGGSIQGNEIFRVATDRHVWFETRVKTSDADQIDLCVGLTVNFAADPEAILTAADRIVFQVVDGSAAILCKTEKDGTETSTDSGVALQDDTYVALSIRVVGTGVVEFYINRRLVATHTTNIPDDENLTVAAMSLSGSATGTHVSTLDYIFAAQTR